MGVAELLVVKQQIIRYDPADIAHIENVLDGEGKVRTHRKIERIEEEAEWSSEETVSQERELEATERFELTRKHQQPLKRTSRRALVCRCPASTGHG